MKHTETQGDAALIGSIYEAALDPGRWLAVLDRVRIRLGASNGLLFTPELSPTEGLWHGLNFSDAVARDYAAYYRYLDMYCLAAARANWFPGRTLLFSNELVPAPAFARSEFYNDHLRERDMFHACWTLNGRRASQGDPLTVFGFYRPPGGEPLEPDNVQTLRRLSPHLLRAAEIGLRLRAADAEGRAGLALLEHLPSAVLLLSDTGHVIHANRRAGTLLSVSDGLAVKRGRLEASDPVAGRVLARLIGQCAETGRAEGHSAGGGLRVPRPSGKPAWAVLVAPLRIEVGRPGWTDLSPGGARRPARRVCAAVFIAGPEARALVPEHLLHVWFGLTPGEARVALDVANGYSAEEIAQHAGLAWHTVRTHLKALYEKMGVKRQNELAKKVLTCPGMALAMEEAED